MLKKFNVVFWQKNEKIKGLAFAKFDNADYLNSRIFSFLGMSNTIIFDQKFVASSNKTEGVIPGTKISHHRIPLIGSGVIYSNLTDFIRYSRF